MQKILFFSQDGKLGDAIVNTAFVAALEGKVELHVSVNGATAEFWERDPRIARCWRVEQPSWSESVRLGMALRRERFDAVVTWNPVRKEKTRLMLRLAAPGKIVNLRQWHLGASVRHKVHDCAEALRQLGFPVPDELRYKVQYPLGNSALPAAPYVVLNVCAADAERTLQPEAAVALARGLRAALPEAQLVLSSTLATRAAVQAIADASGAILWETQGDLAGLFSLCREAALVVSPDTALVHVAAAFCTAVIGLYQDNGVKAVQWAPHGTPGATVLSDNPETVHGFGLDEVLEHARRLVRIKAPVSA